MITAYSNRICPSTRIRIHSGFTLVPRMTLKILVKEHALRHLAATGIRCFSLRAPVQTVKNISKSGKKAKKNEGNKQESFIWSDDEVELLLVNLRKYDVESDRKMIQCVHRKPNYLCHVASRRRRQNPWFQAVAAVENGRWSSAKEKVSFK